MGEVIEELPHLTARQLDVLAWVFGFWVSHQHGPTQREIVAGLGTSTRTSTAAAFVEPLVAKGYLERTQASSRNIRPTPKATRKLTLEGKIERRKETDAQKLA